MEEHKKEDREKTSRNQNSNYLKCITFYLFHLRQILFSDRCQSVKKKRECSEYRYKNRQLSSVIRWEMKRSAVKIIVRQPIPLKVVVLFKQLIMLFQKFCQFFLFVKTCCLILLQLCVKLTVKYMVSSFQFKISEIIFYLPP